MSGSSSAVGRALANLGAHAVAVAEQVGGIVVLAYEVVRALLPPRIDTRELTKNLYKMGNRSVPIVVLTAFFAGGLMTLQSGPFVKRLGATGLAGWGAGYAVLREIGPILIGLMFSGRVGANNTAELATMTVTEQLDGLRALAIDPVRFLVVPRVHRDGRHAGRADRDRRPRRADRRVGGRAHVARHRMVDDVPLASPTTCRPYDFLHGVYKSMAFGGAIAVSSCYFGVTVRGGAVGVGRAVNAAVVAAAVSIMLLDFFMTYLTG